MEEKDELKRQAQQKLADAWKLIREAGQLAEQGNFTLHFGEVGSYVPKSLLDKGVWREKARKELEKTGREQYNHSTHTYDVTPWDELSVDEQEALIDDYANDFMYDEIGYDRVNYDVGPGWWHPSRC